MNIHSSIQTLPAEYKWSVGDCPTLPVDPQMLISPRGRKKVRISNKMNSSQAPRNVVNVVKLTTINELVNTNLGSLC